MGFEFNNDYFSIISGSKSTVSRAYMEAKSVGADTAKGMMQLKSFVTSIETIAAEPGVQDERISSSRGRITDFVGYQNIKTAMSFISKNLGKIETLGNLNTIYTALDNNSTQYADGYNRGIRLIMLEYECAVYLLVTGLAMIMANNIDLVTNGSSIKIKKKSGGGKSATDQLIRDMAKQIGDKNHKNYLEAIMKAHELDTEAPVSSDTPTKTPEPVQMSQPTSMGESAYFTEGFVDVVVDIFASLKVLGSIFSNIGSIGKSVKKLFVGVKSTIFGIVPLIRSVLYHKYKKKADTIVELDQQCDFIRHNIERIETHSNMDPKKKAVVIMKQKAAIERYQKKAAKLRAQLYEGEREATTVATRDEPQIAQDADDEFVLEYSGAKLYQEIYSISSLRRSSGAGSYDVDVGDGQLTKMRRRAVDSDDRESSSSSQGLQKLLDQLNDYYKMHKKTMSKEDIVNDPDLQVIPDENYYNIKMYGEGWRDKVVSAFLAGKSII